MLKQFFFTTAILLGVVFIASGQDYEPLEPVGHRSQRTELKKVKFGVYFAPNISWMKPTASKSDDGNYRIQSGGSKAGYTWGLILDYFFADNYGISTGFQVNTSGGRIQANHIGSSVPVASTVYLADFKYTVQYLELPFHLKFRTDEISTSRIKAFGQLGLTAGANIGKKATYNVTYTDQHATLQYASGSKERLKGGLTMAPVMLQLNIGAGVERAISDKLTAYAGIFFNNGLLPDATNPKEFNLDYMGQFDDGKVRLNNVALRIGIFF